MKQKSFAVIAAIAFFLTACAGGTEIAVAPTSPPLASATVPLPTATIAPTQTAVPTMTPTMPPTQTPTPTATSTPVPTATPVLPPARRLKTGELIFEDWRKPVFTGTMSRLIVQNNLDQDVVIVLQKTTGTVGAKYATYVRAGERFDKPGLGEETYSFHMMVGEDWDNEARIFTRHLELRYLGTGMVRAYDTGNVRYYTNFTVALSPTFKGDLVQSGFPPLK